jgi:hypothetical protein
MDGPVHRVAERAVHELVLLDERLPLEGLRHYPRLIMIFGTSEVDDLDIGVGQGNKQQPSNAFGSHLSLASGYLTQGLRPVNVGGGEPPFPPSVRGVGSWQLKERERLAPRSGRANC